MKKPKLVKDWKNFPTWLSVQISTVGGTACMAWMGLPDEQQKSLLAFLGVRPAAVVAVTFFAIVVGRLIQQGDEE